MRKRRWAAVGVAFVGAVLTGLTACGGYTSSSPHVDGGDGGGCGSVLPSVSSHDAAATVSDPLDDTFVTTGVSWDLTALTVARDAGGITATLDFSRDVVSPSTGDASAVIAVLDLDLDQSALTGTVAVADEFRQDGKSSGLGVDARVALADLAADGTVPVRDALGRITGRVMPVYSRNRITVHVPTALVAGDDGYVSAVAIAGALGKPTDIVPNVGSLALERPGSSAARLLPPLAFVAGNTGGSLRLAAASHLRAASSPSSLYATGRINDTFDE